MIYRLKQLYNALLPEIEKEELIWLKEILNEKELKLFSKQLLTEQRHALDVASDIFRQRSRIISQMGDVAYENLLKAALLHDCGKSLVKLRLWQRVFVVLYGNLPPKTRLYITGLRNVFSKTIVIYKLHPAWGKHLAAKAGVNQQVLELIENHHKPRNPLEEIIFEADNRH